MNRFCGFVNVPARSGRAVLLGFVFLLGCGQKPASDAFNDRPRETSRAEREIPASGAERYDLSRDEDRGGHTLRKHVGRTDEELRERLRRERDISAASTWTDRAAAELTVAAALRSNRNKIENWTHRGDRRPNLALHFDAGHDIGRSMVQGSDHSVPCTEAVVVLRADGDGFYVLTTYPEASE